MSKQGKSTSGAKETGGARNQETPLAQDLRAGTSQRVGNAVTRGLGSPNAPLDDETRRFFEGRFGQDFGRVRIHAGSEAAQSALALRAEAFTAGSDIVFGLGRYQPRTALGRALLAHELAHVAQQPDLMATGRSPRLSNPLSPAELTATANAQRILAGVPPSEPGTAEAGVIYRTIKEDLNAAIAGWGTDEEAIYTRIENATAEEKTAVLADPILMQDLQDDLTGGEWGKVLRLLGAGTESRIHAAAEGWGTDEDAIFDALRGSSGSDLKRQIESSTILLVLRDELSDGDLGRALAIIAEKFFYEATITFAQTYHVLVLFPDAVPDACQHLANLGVNVVTNIVAHLPRGHLMPADVVADVNTQIENDSDLARVEAAFEARWNLDLRTRAAASGKVPNWTVSLIRKVNRALQQVPSGHVVRAAQDVAGVAAGEIAAFQLDALKPYMGAWDASRGTILVGEEFGDIAGLTRHEVGHAVDSFLGGTTTAFKQNAVNGWRWSSSCTTWEVAMANPWSRKDGSVVPAADQVSIRAHLDNYITGDGSAGLRAGTPAGHAIRTYWSDDVPMIEAAKSLAGKKDKVWNDLGSVRKVGSRYFSWSAYYHEFYVYNALVQDQRLTDYQLFGHPEFFAEMYEAYYADGTGPKRGEKLTGVPNWKQFFDNTVHTAVLT